MENKFWFLGGASASEIQFLVGRLKSIRLSSLRSFPFPRVEAQSGQGVAGWLTWNLTATFLLREAFLGGSLLGPIFSEEIYLEERLQSGLSVSKARA